MSDDLVRALWKGVADVDRQQEAAARIEELEAELAKVKEAFRNNMMHALPYYTHEMFDKDYAKIVGEDLG
jgi:hypothetical protein